MSIHRLELLSDRPQEKYAFLCNLVFVAWHRETGEPIERQVPLTLMASPAEGEAPAGEFKRGTPVGAVVFLDGDAYTELTEGLELGMVPSFLLRSVCSSGAELAPHPEGGYWGHMAVRVEAPDPEQPPPEVPSCEG